MNSPFLNNNNREQKAALIQEQGILLADRTQGKHFIYLFSIESSYAELWYRHDTYELDLVMCFQSTSLLESYLEEVNLPSLLL